MKQKRHEMRHTREDVCAAVLLNDQSPELEPGHVSVHTGISEISDGLIWYEFVDGFVDTKEIFWATLDQKGGLWISE